MREEKNKFLQFVGMIELRYNSVGVDRRYYLAEILFACVLSLIVHSYYFLKHRLFTIYFPNSVK